MGHQDLQDKLGPAITSEGLAYMLPEKQVEDLKWMEQKRLDKSAHRLNIEIPHPLITTRFFFPCIQIQVGGHRFEERWPTVLELCCGNLICTGSIVTASVA